MLRETPWKGSPARKIVDSTILSIGTLTLAMANGVRWYVSHSRASCLSHKPPSLNACNVVTEQQTVLLIIFVANLSQILVDDCILFA